jgi:hypothetical protein
MADVSAAKESIRAAGVEIVFVHGATAAEAAPWFARFGLSDVLVISDPELAHYRAFRLGHPGAGALANPILWARGAVCALSHGFGTQTTVMMRQLPGVFLVQGDRVLAEYRHRSPADRPNYLSLVRSADNPLQ